MRSATSISGRSLRASSYEKEYRRRFLDQLEHAPLFKCCERIVFKPLSKGECWKKILRDRREGRSSYPEGAMGAGRYEDSVVSLAA